jgi:dihydropteroate synthase
MAPARRFAPLYCGKATLDLDRPAVMGIVNLSPDSFSGDGMASDRKAAVAYAEAQVAAGADILDLGAESSRPGAQPIPLAEELARILPLLHALRDFATPISVDTSKPEVMRAAIDCGASIINDIFALRRPGALDAVARSNCAICLMHMQGEPQGMQTNPYYENVTEEVALFLQHRVSAAEAAGIDRRRCWIDPGFGFGKALEHNIALFKSLGGLVARGNPVLVGVSRKSMLGALTGRLIEQRMPASIVAAALAAQAGVAVIRAHDVAATIDGVKVGLALAT